MNRHAALFFLAFLFAISFSTVTLAAGPYDGIWQLSLASDTGSYASIHEDSDNTMIVVFLASDFEWEAVSGQRDMTDVNLVTIASGVNISLSLTFTSSDTAAFTQISCVPITTNSTCNLIDGTTFGATRIFK